MDDPAATQALSPLDGRYRAVVAPLAEHFSEAGLFRARFTVEIEWLRELAARPEIGHVRPLTAAESGLLEEWEAGFGASDVAAIKQIEAVTRHDVKAVEYYIRDRLKAHGLDDLVESVHFGCTSEDINNLAYGLMLRHGLGVWRDRAEGLVSAVAERARATRALPLLARTHGQPATPSTLGKELAVFVSRWRRQLRGLDAVRILGKFNGAVGTYSAHVVAYPEAPWIDIARRFVERLGLGFSPLSTQIEAHDYMAELFHALARFNTVTLNFDRDMWAYISLGYFAQVPRAGEVGSSTMPHKINPIAFENSEANLGISNGLLGHLASTLPVSRLQRDLSDSSALRNVGSALGYSVVALTSAAEGFRRIVPDRATLQRDLDGGWEVLGEAVQTVLRKVGYPNGYELLKDFTRGAAVTEREFAEFVRGLPLPAAERERLLRLRPQDYVGLAARLVDFMGDPPAATPSDPT